MTDPTPQAPPQGLTDEQLLELMPEQFRADLATASRLAAKDAGPDTKPGVFRVILNTGAVTYARAAIAAHEAQRMEWLKGSREIAILTAAIDGRIAATVEAAPAPAQGLTDARLLELAASEIEPFPPDYEAGRGRPLEVYGCELIAFARAAIAADRAATVEAARPQPTREEVEARFLAWWAESYPHAPVGSHAVASHVAFALHLLGGEVQ